MIIVFLFLSLKLSIAVLNFPDSSIIVAVKSFSSIRFGSSINCTATSNPASSWFLNTVRCSYLWILDSSCLVFIFQTIESVNKLLRHHKGISPSRLCSQNCTFRKASEKYINTALKSWRIVKVTVLFTSALFMKSAAGTKGSKDSDQNNYDFVSQKIHECS